MSAQKNVNKIPLAIRASTPKDLSLICYKNNIINDVQFEYFDFQKDNEQWICFFYADLQFIRSFEFIDTNLRVGAQ